MPNAITRFFARAFQEKTKSCDCGGTITEHFGWAEISYTCDLCHREASAKEWYE